MKLLVKTFKLKQSGPPRGMSRTDNPYNNAWAESLWTGPPGCRLKAELEIPKGGYSNLVALRSVLFDRDGPLH